MGRVMSMVKVCRAPLAPVLDQNGSRLFVPCVGGDAVAVLNVSERSLLKTIRVGASPQALVQSSDGADLYVANGRSGTVSVVDLTSLEVRSTIKVGEGPSALAFDRKRSRVYVANWGSGDAGAGASLSVVDPQLDLATATIPLPERASQVILHPSQPYLYVVSNKSAGVVTVVDLESLTIFESISVGSYPVGAVLNRSGSLLFVANYVSNSLSTIETGAHELVSTVPAGLGPLAPVTTAQGSSVYVSNYFSKPLSRSITRVGMDGVGSATKLRVNRRPGPAVANALGSRLFVPSTKDPLVSVISLAPFRVVGRVDVSSVSARPEISKDGRWMYLAHTDQDAVSFVDLRRASSPPPPATQPRREPPSPLKPPHILF
jgi:YVTN family beta-propeller protein